MNRKEISEIKKQLKPEKSTISRICCCYVNHEKEKLLETCGKFLTLEEEEQFKYFELFKKTLSGGLGKNLHTLAFPLEAEYEGGAQEFLLRLLRSKLEDEALVDEFFDRVIANYAFAEHYLILLVYADYDVPGRGKDNLEQFDASDTVYSHMICAICPVKRTEPGLSYDPERNALCTRLRDWVVENPMDGFLFPAFHDRQTDLHAALYYTGKAEELQGDLIDTILGSPVPLSAGTQKDVFRELVSEAIEKSGDFDTAKTLTHQLGAIVEAAKEAEEPAVLEKPDMLRLLEDAGVPEEDLKDFGENYDRLTGETGGLAVSNVTERRCSVVSSAIKITMPPEDLDLLEVKMVDHRPCLLIPLEDQLEVNGIPVPVWGERGEGAPEGDADEEESKGR